VRSAKTSSSGGWRLTSFAPGSYTVTVSANGYPTKTLTMTASAGTTVLAEAVLG